MPNNDLISRAEAIDALTNTNLKRNVDSVYDGDMNRTRRAAQRVIAQLPAVDAVSVKHGRWVHDGDPVMLSCSMCGYRVFGYNNTHYCPNCGAKMDEKEK